MRIIRLDECESTNEYIKRSRLSGDVCVVARVQTGGRGTKGRSFSSQAGGVYASFVREYGNFPAADAFKIMIDACTAVCRTLQGFGLSPVVRWPNDVLVGGRKISGTLIENTLSGELIARSVVGIGINVNNRLPAELSGIATAMCEWPGGPFEEERVFGALCENMSKSYSVAEYKRYIDWLGSEIILKRERDEAAVALDIAEDGKLVCASHGTIFAVSAAEVGLRLKDNNKQG